LSKDLLFTYLGLARRSGQLLVGQDQIKKAFIKNEGLVVLLSEDASESTRRKFLGYEERKQCKIETIPLTGEELSKAIGTTNTQIVALPSRSGFAVKIQAMLAEGGNIFE
jgi:ribosomal protein L7Ae-like RNA K-turn-binding protein